MANINNMRLLILLCFSVCIVHCTVDYIVNKKYVLFDTICSTTVNCSRLTLNATFTIPRNLKYVFNDRQPIYKINYTAPNLCVFSTFFYQDVLVMRNDETICRDEKPITGYFRYSGRLTPNVVITANEESIFEYRPRSDLYVLIFICGWRNNTRSCCEVKYNTDCIASAPNRRGYNDCKLSLLFKGNDPLPWYTLEMITMPELISDPELIRYRTDFRNISMLPLYSEVFTMNLTVRYLGCDSSDCWTRRDLLTNTSVYYNYNNTRENEGCRKTNFNLRKYRTTLPVKDPILNPILYDFQPMRNMFTGELMPYKNLRRL